MGDFSLLTLKNTINNLFKGYLIGIGATVPGISGGTIAILLNVYEDILDATGNVYKHIRKSIVFLFPIFIGVCLGAFSFSFPIKFLCENIPLFSKLIFCCISLFSTIYFAKTTQLDFRNFHVVKYLIFGIFSSIAFSIVSSLITLNYHVHTPLILFIYGIPLSLALILPAISFSYMLLFFGLYDFVINSLNSLEILSLTPLLFGITFGSLIFSKLLLKLLKSNKTKTYSFVLGFVISSITDILI